MVQDFTLHTHTAGFDGKNTVAEMATCARNMGFGAIGISNHFIVHPNIRSANFYSFAVRGGYAGIYQYNFPDILEKYRAHYDEINRVSMDMRMPILRGMEVDFFDTPHWRNGFEYAVKTLKPDYVIGACHFIEYKGKLCNVHDMAAADHKDMQRMLDAYWAKVRRAAQSGLFTFMAHLDLPKKVGLGMSDEWRATEYDTVSTLAQSGVGVEVNTGLFTDTCYQPYPSPRIISMLARAGVPVVFSDDAHHTSQIGRNFNRAKLMCDVCGQNDYLSLQKILDFSKNTR